LSGLALWVRQEREKAGVKSALHNEAWSRDPQGGLNQVTSRARSSMDVAAPHSETINTWKGELV